MRNEHSRLKEAGGKALQWREGDHKREWPRYVGNMTMSGAKVQSEAQNAANLIH